MLLEKYLKLIASAFIEREIRFSLVGGLALSAWIDPRSTKGIDIIVENVENLRIDDALNAIDFNRSSAPMTINFLKFRRVSKLLIDDTLLTLDLMEHTNKEFCEAILNDAIIIKMDEIDLPVASPEVLVLLKEQSTRPVDQLDVIKLKENCHLDKDYISRWKNQF